MKIHAAKFIVVMEYQRTPPPGEERARKTLPWGNKYMPHRVFSAAQLRAMRTEEEVVLHDELLPSLRQVFEERGMEWKNEDEETLRQQIQPLQPLEYECSKLRALRQELECPICRQVPRTKEIVFVCSAHHHLCFSCLLSILRVAHQRGVEPACPMRCGEMHIQDAPAPAFRGMLALLDTPQTHYLTETYQVYAGLHRCGYYTGSWFNVDNLSHFATCLVDNTNMWQRAQKCVHMYLQHVAYFHALPPPPTESSEITADAPGNSSVFDSNLDLDDEEVLAMPPPTTPLTPAMPPPTMPLTPAMPPPAMPPQTTFPFRFPEPDSPPVTPAV